MVTDLARPGMAGHLGAPFGLGSLPRPPGLGCGWDGVGWAGAGCEGVVDDAGFDGDVLVDGGAEGGTLGDGEPAPLLGLGVPADRRSVSQ